MLWGRREARKVEAKPVADRRCDPRLDKVFRVYLEGDHGCGLGIARNISEGGMFVETRAPQPIGTQVKITFPSDSGDMVAVAEVRYVCHLLGRAPATERGPLAMRGMGIRFLYFELEPGAVLQVH
jgi:PilZ domain-containing protein